MDFNLGHLCLSTIAKSLAQSFIHKEKTRKDKKTKFSCAWQLMKRKTNIADHSYFGLKYSLICVSVIKINMKYFKQMINILSPFSERTFMPLCAVFIFKAMRLFLHAQENRCI